MSEPQQNVRELLELANHYPSPHNGQPIRVKQVEDDTFELYFERERGLQAADISFIFSFVSMGVFVEHLALCAESLGHIFNYTLSLPKESDLRGEGAVVFGDCKLGWHKAEPNERLKKALLFRQTSRKKYFEGPSRELVTKAVDIARRSGMNLVELDSMQTKQAIWLNQRAVFDDMFDEPVRKELNHWLRYSKTEKESKLDGLSYDCMELNGGLMKFSVDHPGILHAPVLSWFIKQYYLRTMEDSSSVLYMLAPFSSEQESFDVGITIMRIWRAVASEGYYLHPFGTIMSNHTAHRDFLDLAQIQNESRDQNYLVFIFRCGRSEPPVKSLRLPITEHLMMD